MPSATAQPNTNVEELIARVTALSEQIAEVAAKAGSKYLDTFDTSLKSVAELQQRFAEEVNDPFLAALVEGQAKVTRELIKLNSANRELLK